MKGIENKPIDVEKGLSTRASVCRRWSRSSGRPPEDVRFAGCILPRLTASNRLARPSSHGGAIGTDFALYAAPITDSSVHL